MMKPFFFVLWLMENKIDVRRFKLNNLNTREVNIGAVGNASLCLLTLVTLTENNF